MNQVRGYQDRLVVLMASGRGLEENQSVAAAQWLLRVLSFSLVAISVQGYIGIRFGMISFLIIGMNIVNILGGPKIIEVVSWYCFLFKLVFSCCQGRVRKCEENTLPMN